MKILVITLGRTGSSNFCKQLQKEYNIPNLGEYFKTNKESVKNIDYLLQKKSWICKIIPLHLIYLEEQLYHLDLLKQNNRLSKLNERLVLAKVSSKFRESGELKNLVNCEDIEYCSRFLNSVKKLMLAADKIIYLYSSDFKRQVKSMCAASITGDFSRDRNVADRITIPDDMISFLGKDLLVQWMVVKMLYSAFPGEVVSTEKDLLFSTKYPKQNISCNESLIPELCIEREIFNLH